SELPISETISPKLVLPIAIGVDLIDEDRAVLAAMSGQISLTVAVNVQPPHHAPALHGRLPNRGVNRLPPPRDVARQAYVDRKQACRHSLLRARAWTVERSVIPVDEVRARRPGLERLAEILRLAGHLSVAEFHDAHGVRRDAVIGEHQFGDPEVALAD